MKIPSNFTTSPQGGRRFEGTSPPLPGVEGWAMSWFQHQGVMELPARWWEGDLWRSQHKELLGHQLCSWGLNCHITAASPEDLTSFLQPCRSPTRVSGDTDLFIKTEKKFLPLLFTPERWIIPRWLFLEDFTPDSLGRSEDVSPRDRNWSLFSLMACLHRGTQKKLI